MVGYVCVCCLKFYGVVYNVLLGRNDVGNNWSCSWYIICLSFIYFYCLFWFIFLIVKLLIDYVKEEVDFLGGNVKFLYEKIIKIVIILYCILICILFWFIKIN